MNLLQWSQRRNFAKYQIVGMKSMLCNLSRNNVVTLDEQDYLDEACRIITKVADEWKEHNKESKGNFIRLRKRS